MIQFMVDIYRKVDRKFIKRIILTDKEHNIFTEIEALRYIKAKIIEDGQYYRIR